MGAPEAIPRTEEARLLPTPGEAWEPDAGAGRLRSFPIVPAGEVRRILHCDLDCFYAAVHIRDDPSLAGKPVVVGGDPAGRGVVAAASYEARRFGIRSAMPAAQALRLCPQVVFFRPDFPRYHRESQRVFAILRRFTPLVEPVSLDEAYLDMTDHLPPWDSATAAAQAIRRQVRKEVGLTLSVGVGPNRLVAKIACDFGKPDGLTVVPPERVQPFLDPLPVGQLPGVGPATEKALNELDVEIVADLRRRGLAELTEHFGRWGATLYAFARGLDGRPVEVSRERKSLGSETTFPRDLRTLAEMDRALEELVREVAEGLARRSLAARTFTIKVRYGDFTTITRSRTLSAPIASRRTVLAHAQDLLRRTEAGSRPVRLLGVAASGLVTRVEQLSLLEAL